MSLVSFRMFLKAVRSYLRSGRSVVENTVLRPGNTILGTPASEHCVFVPNGVDFSIVRALEMKSESFLKQIQRKGCVLAPFRQDERKLFRRVSKAKRRRKSKPVVQRKARRKTRRLEVAEEPAPTPTRRSVRRSMMPRI